MRINSYGGQIGRFWWTNSDQGGLHLRMGRPAPYGWFSTAFRPGRCGWDEAWPDRHSWPVRPWGKGDAADDVWRDFAAFEPWFDRQMEGRKLDHVDLNITKKIDLYDMLCAVFHCGIDAGRNPWSWAKHVEQQQQQTQHQEEQ